MCDVLTCQCLCLHAVASDLLTNDAYSQQMLSAYNSIDVRVNVTISNKASYVDLGTVARANHHRLANKLVSEGFNVVSRHLARCIECLITTACSAWLVCLAKKMMLVVRSMLFVWRLHTL